MELIKPTVEYKDSFIQAIKEFQAEGQERYTKINASELEMDFNGFLEKVEKREKGIDLPRDYVPESQFWLIDEGEFIGTVYLRHILNERLLMKGGHIGYFIRPSKRKMGYGTKILELALVEAKKLGIDKVLVTCDDDNIGSIKVIEKNGGIMENKIIWEGELKKRYWIENK